MRVVAGEAKGRRLVAPGGEGTRPTSDRVREATFNALESIGAVEGADVLDLFAGSGALGIEALSRGAARCTFVDVSTAAVRTIRANLAASRLEEQAVIVRSDALSFLDRCDRYDLVLADPPYAFDRWPELLARLKADLVVAESDRALEPGSGWRISRQRRYGGTVVSFVVGDDSHVTG